MELNLDFDLTQLDEIFLLFEKKVDKFGLALLDETEKVIQRTQLFKGNGRLRNDLTKISSGSTFSITANAPYASFVENGRPGFSAKNAKCLRFVINGEVIFAKHVGPQKATHFMQNSVESAMWNAQVIWNSLG